MGDFIGAVTFVLCSGVDSQRGNSMHLWQSIVDIANCLDPILSLLQAVIAFMAVIVAVLALRQNEKLRRRSAKLEILSRWFLQAYPVNDYMFALEERSDESALSELKIQGLKAETGLVEVCIQDKEFNRVMQSKDAVASVLQHLCQLYIHVHNQGLSGLLGEGNDASSVEIKEVISNHVFDRVLETYGHSRSDLVEELKTGLGQQDPCVVDVSNAKDQLLIQIRNVWCITVELVYNKLFQCIN